MKSIRRSLTKDRERISSPTNFIANPTPPLPVINKSSLAPKNVIRAIDSHRARSSEELSFEKGDFFHVSGDPISGPEGDLWFEAFNPATNIHGYVPAPLFQVLGRNERENTTLQGSMKPRIGPPPTNGSARSPDNSSIPSTSSPSFRHSSKSSPMAYTNSSKQQSLYGVVLYDFHAERADELEATKGEPIIVIAQSNHEWFVAKPIGRLGGPGLIPIAFVEVQNMSTGKALDPNIVAEMIRGGALPPVEEWKRTTAEYKQASIPLGRFDFLTQPAAASTSPTNSVVSSSKPPSAHNTSANGNSPPNPSNGISNIERQQSAGGRQVHSQYSVNETNLQPPYQSVQGSRSSPAATSQSRASNRGSGQKSRSAGARSVDDPLYKYRLVFQASVESFHFEENAYWFHIRASFASGASLVLYRMYDDFFDFQMDLMGTFPVEAGRQPAAEGKTLKRIIPKMPGPVDEVNDRICAQRVNDLSEYLANLCALPEYIREDTLFYDFLAPRPGDVEITGATGSVHSGSGPTGNQDRVEYIEEDEEDEEEIPGVGSLNLDANEAESYSARRRTAGSKHSSEAYPKSRASEGADSLYSNRENNAPLRLSNLGKNNSNSNITSPGMSSMASTPGPSSSTSMSNSGEQIKIKIFHEDTYDLVAIRLGPKDRKLDKVMSMARSRLGNVSRLGYREDSSSANGLANGTDSNDPMIEFSSDREFTDWINSAGRLVLYAN